MIEKCDTLMNVKYRWTIDELMDAHEALDEQAEANKRHAEQHGSK